MLGFAWMFHLHGIAEQDVRYLPCVLSGRSRYSEDLAGPREVFRRDIRNQEKFVGDDRILVLDRLFLRNPKMNQSSRYC